MGRRSIFPPGPFRHALGIHATCESFPNRAIFIDLNDSTASYPDVADCRAAGFGLRARRSLRMDDAMVQSRNPASAPLRRTIAYALTLGAAALLGACSDRQGPGERPPVEVGVIEVAAENVAIPLRCPPAPRLTRPARCARRSTGTSGSGCSPKARSSGPVSRCSEWMTASIVPQSIRRMPILLAHAPTPKPR